MIIFLLIVWFLPNMICFQLSVTLTHAKVLDYHSSQDKDFHKYSSCSVSYTAMDATIWKYGNSHSPFPAFKVLRLSETTEVNCPKANSDCLLPKHLFWHQLLGCQQNSWSKQILRIRDPSWITLNGRIVQCCVIHHLVCLISPKVIFFKKYI